MKMHNNKQGKNETIVYIAVIALAAVAVVALLGFMGVFKTQQAAIGVPVANVSGQLAQQQAAAITNCGSTKQTAVTFNVKNGLNTTGTQYFDMTGYVYQINPDNTETLVSTVSNTTGGSVTLDCGAAYRFKPVTDGSTYNSQLTSVYTHNAQLDNDGSVLFVTSAPSLALGMVGTDHSDIQVRAYDMNARAYMFNTGSAVANQFSANGVVYTSTTDNATATTVGAGSTLDVSFDVQATSTVGNYNDEGVYVLVGSSTANTFTKYWDGSQTQVKFNGAVLPTATLTTNEQQAFSGFSQFYKIAPSNVMGSKTNTVEVSLMKSNGLTGDNNVTIDLIPIGNYLSIDSVHVYAGAAKDDSSYTTVYPTFNITVEATS